jgi:uncharacterized protein HemX
MDRQKKPSHAKNLPQGMGNKRRSRPTTSKSSASKPAVTTSKVTKSKHSHPPQQVRQLPQRYAAPAWLRMLLAVQKISMVLFVSVFGLSSIVYGYTMHTQTTWRSQQDRLRRLQNQERQKAVMNEKLKQQMAQIAEQPGSGLVKPKPGNSSV